MHCAIVTFVEYHFYMIFCSSVDVEPQVSSQSNAELNYNTPHVWVPEVTRIDLTPVLILQSWMLQVDAEVMVVGFLVQQ